MRSAIVAGHQVIDCADIALTPPGQWYELNIVSTTDSVRLERISRCDVPQYKCIKTFSGHNNSLHGADVSPDNRFVVTCSYDSSVRIWSTETGECVHVMNGHTGSVYCVAYSRDGKQVISGGDDKTIKLWSTETGECIQTLTHHTNEVWGVCYSPDGKQAASASFDKRVIPMNTSDWSLRMLSMESAAFCVK